MSDTDHTELRDRLAEQALVGLLANPDLSQDWRRAYQSGRETRVLSEVCGPLAYKIADAAIAYRNRAEEGADALAGAEEAPETVREDAA